MNDYCANCDRMIGRAGRTNDEIIAAIEKGEFLTAFGCTDYSQEPPVTTYYCSTCYYEKIIK